MRRFVDDENSCCLREFLSPTIISFVAIKNNDISRRLKINVTIIVLSLLDKVFLFLPCLIEYFLTIKPIFRFEELFSS